ncbi:gfo/Idh/MocA family oxidoreductase [Desertihabitans brevis]|uniref:Gfo/Idh/MocA family oxidoreductase n=1 Tax=Desertihabitans brevis TaxID=2268447 RepID=A0A367YVF3_9ACTN|nr:Gfo/Idh/MocA family oxidoreductase [Desertihabitans brevis]RCK68931.1 gfo/Idh/MocA family oxidoreductase [Desertihabitans brevis]
MSTTSSPTPTSGPVRVLVVGCGVIGKHHGIVLTRHPSFEVVGLVDPVAERASAVAQAVVDEGGTAPQEYTDLDTALAAGGADLAAICTPSGMHVDQAEQALARGLHVVIEKPLDVTVSKSARFTRLAAEAAERGQVVSVISQHRFDPGAVVVRRTLDEGGFGTLTCALASMSWYRSQGYYDSGDWRGTWELDGGGAVMNQGVHTVDLLRWFLGRPVEVFAHVAQLAHERVEVEDTATATVRFESGALATIFCTTAAYPGLTTRVQVHGTRGSAIIDNDELRYLHVGDGEAADNLRAAKVTGNQAEAALGDEFAGSRNEPDKFVAGHLRQYDDIAAAISEGRAPLVGAEDALLSQALVRSIYVSAALGQAVQVQDVLDGRHDDVEPVVPGATPATVGVPA